MATDTLKAGIPIISLDSGYQVVFEAIDPTTGNVLTDVVIENVAIYGDDLAAATDTTSSTVVLKSALLPG